jgi:hypothetical protein
MDNSSEFEMGGAHVELNGQDVGIIAADGLSVEGLTPEVHEIMSNRHLAPVGVVMVNSDMRIMVTMLQVNSDNMLAAIPGLIETLNGFSLQGYPGQRIVPVELKVIPVDGTRTYTFHNVVPVELGALQFTKEDERRLEVTFRVIDDLTSFELGSIEEQAS